MLVLSQAVIYMLVVLVEVLQPTGEMTVDYLQNDAPSMIIQVEPVQNSDDDVYIVTASPASTIADGETLTVRIEQTDLYAHNYLVFVPGSPPEVIDLGPIRRQLAGVNLTPGDGQPFDVMFEPAGTAESRVAGESAPSGRASVGTPVAGPLHLLGRLPYLLLTAPAEAVVLIAR